VANEELDVAEHGYALSADRGDGEAALSLGRRLLRHGDADGAARRLLGPAAADLPGCRTAGRSPRRAEKL
jgi:hypothetical protein